MEVELHPFSGKYITVVGTLSPPPPPPHGRVRALCSIGWLPRTLEDTKVVAAPS